MLVGDQDSAVALHGNIAAFSSAHVGWCIFYLMHVCKCELWTARSIKRGYFKGQAGNNMYWRHNDDGLSLRALSAGISSYPVCKYEGILTLSNSWIAESTKKSSNWGAQLDITWYTTCTRVPSWWKAHISKSAVLLHMYQIFDPTGLKTGLKTNHEN